MIAIEAESAHVIWHDVENGSYGADLTLWEDLAAATAWGGSGVDVLDLGAGTGRVAIHLARRGHRVWALDSDPVLVDALRERVSEPAAVFPLIGDARDFALGRRFNLIIAPMQLAHLLDSDERRSMLRSISAHLEPGGFAAFALMAETPEPWRAGEGEAAPLPDVTERGAWIFSSLPLSIERSGRGVTIRRLRQTVSPDGNLSDVEHVFDLTLVSPEDLGAEAAEAGLRAREQRAVPETDDYVGSTVIVLEHAG